MMKGKKRCKILKEIRRQIAENNDIEFVTSECKHKGDCLGTCPKCEAEVRYLERELEKRAKLGKAVAVAGLSVALMTSTAGCDQLFFTKETGGDPVPPDRYEDELGGKDVPVPDKGNDEGELSGKPMPPEEEDVELGGDPDIPPEPEGDIPAPDEDWTAGYIIAPPEDEDEDDDEDVELGGDPLPPEETMGDIP